jgi:radical SAM protein with 4Fe4S-binding SPASM domain
VTNSTLSLKNAADFEQTLEFLHGLGVRNFACNGFIHSGEAVGNDDGIEEKALPAILEKIRDKAEALEMNFIWYTPTQYCNCNPVELELGMRRCTAGTSNMCIEPNGDVLPCQSYYETLGNILTDDWPKIWNHETLVGIRNRTWLDPKCDGCDDLQMCGGGCPLYLKNGKSLCSDAMSNPG